MRFVWADSVRFWRYEVTRWWSMRSLRVILMSATFCSAVVGALLAQARPIYGDPALSAWETVGTQGASIGLPPLSALCVGLIGIVLWADDVDAASAITTRLTFPRVTRMACARLVAQSALVFICALVVWGFAVVTASLTTRHMPSASGLGVMLMVKALRYAAFSTVFACVASAATMSMRSPVAAGLLLLLIPTAIEPTVVQLSYLMGAPEVVLRQLSRLPFSAMNDLLATPSDQGLTFGPPHLTLRTAAAEAAIIGTLATLATALRARRAGITE